MPDDAEIIRLTEEDDLRQKQERNAVFRGLARLGSGAVPLATAIDLAAGTPAVFTSIIGGATTFFLGEAKNQLDIEGRNIDMKKSGFSLPIDIAVKGSGKSEVIRKLWLELLKNSMDDNFNHSIRRSDIELLNSLESPDAILLLMKSKNHQQMNQDWIRRAGQGEIGLALQINNKMIPKHIKECFNCGGEKIVKFS